MDAKRAFYLRELSYEHGEPVALSRAELRHLFDEIDALEAMHHPMPTPPTETEAPLDRRHCQHLEMGCLPKHAMLRLATVPDDQNSTSYRHRLEVELCTYCSGVAAGRFDEFASNAPVSAVPDKANPFAKFIHQKPAT